MADLLCLGELLIDFTPSGESENKNLLFARNPGGAPANVAVQAARLGLSSAFLGKVGDDIFGHFLKETLVKNGVDTSHLLLDATTATTLAFVQLTPEGDRNFSFYRNPGADTQLREDELDLPFISSAKALCFGSLLLTNEPSRTAVYRAVSLAREKGVLTAYDPNWRPPLWQDKAEGLVRMRSLVSQADIIKVSDEEMALITEKPTLTEGAQALLSAGVKLVICTLGPKGCLLFTKEHAVTRSTYDVKVKDTNGSGDSFFGTFLAQLIALGKAPDALSLSELEALADFANAAGSACATKPGAIPALPTREEIEAVRSTVPQMG